LCCLGQITSPPDGTNFTFLPGSTAKIQWTFGNDINTVQSRIWYFTGSDDSESVIARIVDNDPPREIPNNTLPGVTIETPATLVLNNVDKRYNGKYRFSLLATGVGSDRHVVVFIAGKFNLNNQVKLMQVFTKFWYNIFIETTSSNVLFSKYCFCCTVLYNIFYEC
jgi:hypothetical protein